MPQMADIIVKKNDGTTNVTYSAVNPSSGDKTAAVWKSLAVGTAPAHNPELRATGKETQRGTHRQVHLTYQYPQLYTDSTTTLTMVQDRGRADATFDFPKSMTQADINELVSQFANLVSSTLIKDSAKSGYAPS